MINAQHSDVVLMFEKIFFTWRFKKQPIVSRSSAEVEIRALAYVYAKKCGYKDYLMK